MKTNNLLSCHKMIISTVLILFGASLGVTGCRPTEFQTIKTKKTASKEAVSKAAEPGWTPKAWTDYNANGPTENRLPSFSFAGYAMGRQPIPHIQGPLMNVTHPPFNAKPDDGQDDTAAIQAAIDAVGDHGGIIFLPKGRYDLHTTIDAPFLRIYRSNVVLRGEGSDTSGTILHLGAPGKAGGVRRLGTVPADAEARHQAAVAVIGSEERTRLTRYTRDIARGTRVVGVLNSDRFKPGQTVIIEFSDPEIDPQQPAPEKADLAAQLTAPFQLGPAQTDTFGPAARSHTWIVRIKEIIDPQTLCLTRPARFNQWLRYHPEIYSFNGVSEVGIEHLRIQSSWPGGYCHHKPFKNVDGTVIRTAKEQDYLWNGIWISSATNGWVRDVTFKDVTQGIIVSRAADLTLEDLEFRGKDGHAGITIAHSNDILVRKADFYARLVHPVTMTMMAAGNVVTQCTAHYQGRDEHNATDAVIDFHGIFPYENLFDNLQGFYICPGGDLSVMPHAGVRNVFWNIQAPGKMSCYTCDTDNEFARTYDFASTTSKTAATMFEHFPQAFYIGIGRQGNRKVTIAGTSEDQQSPWMTVEGLNRPDISIPSLYEAQRQSAP